LPQGDCAHEMSDANPPLCLRARRDTGIKVQLSSSVCGNTKTDKRRSQVAKKRRGCKKMIALRPYQDGCLDAITSAWARGTNRQLVVLPTGVGKTIIFSALAKAMDSRTLITAHRDELIQQAADKVQWVWEDADIGIVKAEQNELSHQVVIASVQTLSQKRRLEQLDTDFELIITDEAHHAIAKSYRRIYSHLGLDERKRRGKLHVGVTATANRTDNIGLEAVFDEVVFYRSIIDMIPDYLCDLRCVQLHTEIDVSGVKTRGDDLDPRGLADVLDTENATDLIIDGWKRYARDRLTLVFAADVRHAKHLAQAFRNEGIEAEAIWGEMPLDKRRGVLSDFAKQKIQVVTNFGVLTEGYDNPAVDCIVMARPTKSAMLYCQMMGRGMRLFPQKEECLILDVACVSDRHELISFPKLFGLKAPPDPTQTLVKQLEAESSDVTEALTGEGIEGHEVNLFATKNRERDAFSMSQLAWLQTRWGYALNLGTYGWVRIYPAREDETKCHVFYDNSEYKQRLTRLPVDLSWAFGVSESHARVVTSGNLTLVDRDAGWRKPPATDKQIAFLSRLRVDFPPDISKGEASDLIAMTLEDRSPGSCSMD